MNAPITMAQVINIGASRRTLPKTCPWCGSDPGLASLIHGVYYVACESDECFDAGRVAQASGKTVESAWAAWNKRA